MRLLSAIPTQPTQHMLCAASFIEYRGDWSVVEGSKQNKLAEDGPPRDKM